MWEESCKYLQNSGGIGDDDFFLSFGILEFEITQ